MIKRYDIGTRRKKNGGSSEEIRESSRPRPFPAAELSRE
jgi:hypothetical protein